MTHMVENVFILVIFHDIDANMIEICVYQRFSHTVNTVKAVF